VPFKNSLYRAPLPLLLSPALPLCADLVLDNMQEKTKEWEEGGTA